MPNNPEAPASETAYTGITGRIIFAFIWFMVAGLLALLLGQVFALNRREH